MARFAARRAFSAVRVPKRPPTPESLAKGRAFRKLVSRVGSTVNPALGLFDETMCAVEDMGLGAAVPKWVSVGALIAAYFFLLRRK